MVFFTPCRPNNVGNLDFFATKKNLNSFQLSMIMLENQTLQLINTIWVIILWYDNCLNNFLSMENLGLKTHIPILEVYHVKHFILAADFALKNSKVFHLFRLCYKEYTNSQFVLPYFTNGVF